MGRYATHTDIICKRNNKTKAFIYEKAATK